MARTTSGAIAAQSQLKLVMKYTQASGYCVTLADLVSITNVLVEYVEQGWSKELSERLQVIDKHLQENYSKEK